MNNPMSIEERRADEFQRDIDRQAAWEFKPWLFPDCFASICDVDDTELDGEVEE